MTARLDSRRPAAAPSRSVMRLLACALFSLARAASADDASALPGPALQELEVVPLGEGARVSVRFGCPLRYTTHFPAEQATELRISLVPLPGCIAAGAVLEGALRAPAGNAAGLGDVRLEALGSALVLTLTFAAPVDVDVRPSPDFLGLDVAVYGGAAVARPRPQPKSSPPPQAPVTRTLPSAEVLEAQWQEAHTAFDSGDYPTAIRLLTRLIEYPEHPHRAEAQELLGLARERNGQFAHAVAEYDEYLRRYPDGPAAGRVAQHRDALATLDSKPRIAAVGREEGGMNWSAFGGWSQEYRYDSTSIDTGVTSTNFTSQSMVITDGDLSLRGRGERYDVQARVSAGYLYDLLPDGNNSQTRVSIAYGDLADRRYGLSARFGRQSGYSAVLGTFDGLLLGWKPKPTLRLNLVAGSPVDSTGDGYVSNRQFVSVGASLSGWVEGLEISPYVIDQTYDGYSDRRAVGSEVRWFTPGRTVVGLFDYDVGYRAVNMAMLLGTFDLPGNYTLTGSLDHHKSPYLTTRNALSGQPVQSLGKLVALFGEDTVRSLATDRTADGETVSIGLSHPLGTRFQWTADLSATQISDLPASGGVEAIPGSGTEIGVGAQLIGNSLLRSGDVTILGLRWYDGDIAQTISASMSSRFPLWGRLRAGPRLRFDYRTFSNGDLTQWLASPALRVDWNSRHTTIEFEAGGEWGSRELTINREDSSRYWFSLAYRVGF
jgi:tetratricopeptide (TPR) repeat protein